VNSVAMIYPSCAEGQCGGVITCMHAGVIPVISYQSGVDVHDFGMILPDCSIQEIQNAIQHISNLPGKQLEQMARGAWEYARANHTKQKFAQEYRKVIEHILVPGVSKHNDAEPVLLRAAQLNVGEKRGGISPGLRPYLCRKTVRP
jgi:glycosyltransferase involved in cell wall biosynthesis